MSSSVLRAGKCPFLSYGQVVGGGGSGAGLERSSIANDVKSSVVRQVDNVKASLGAMVACACAFAYFGGACTICVGKYSCVFSSNTISGVDRIWLSGI